MKQQHIMFDLDDTLIHCNQYFEVITEQLADRLEQLFAHPEITKEAISQKQFEIDMEGIELFGFSANRFPQSMVETYKFFADQIGQSIDDKVAEGLFQLGLSVYEHEIKPYPYMKKTLNELKYQGHLLYLYTGGDSTIQLNKVKRAGLQSYFADRIYVAQYKTLEFLESLLVKNRFTPEDTWMIGNSERTDVAPALQAGINSIYISRDNEWGYNNVDINIKPKGAYFKIKSLKEIPGVIRSYLLR